MEWDINSIKNHTNLKKEKGKGTFLKERKSKIMMTQEKVFLTLYVPKYELRKK